VAEPPVEIGDHALIGDFANVARAENWRKDCGPNIIRRLGEKNPNQGHGFQKIQWIWPSTIRSRTNEWRKREYLVILWEIWRIGSRGLQNSLGLYEKTVKLLRNLDEWPGSLPWKSRQAIETLADIPQSLRNLRWSTLRGIVNPRKSSENRQCHGTWKSGMSWQQVVIQEELKPFAYRLSAGRQLPRWYLTFSGERLMDRQSCYTWILTFSRYGLWSCITAIWPNFSPILIPLQHAKSHKRLWSSIKTDRPDQLSAVDAVSWPRRSSQSNRHFIDWQYLDTQLQSLFRRGW
jgi:hypothetical protein